MLDWSSAILSISSEVNNTKFTSWNLYRNNSFCDLKNACNIIHTTSDFVSSMSFELLAMYSTRSAIDPSTLVSITLSFFICCYIVTDDI